MLKGPKKKASEKHEKGNSQKIRIDPIVKSASEVKMEFASNGNKYIRNQYQNELKYDFRT